MSITYDCLFIGRNMYPSLCVTGILHAKAMYSDTKWVQKQNYAIDPINDPANLYYCAGIQDVTITLPNAFDFKGIVLRFLNCNYPDNGHWGIKLVSAISTQLIHTKSGWGQGETGQTFAHIINRRVVTLVAANQEWWVLDGEIRTTPEEIIY